MQNIEILNELNIRQHKAVNYLIAHEKITNKEYRELNPEISPNIALNDLKQLVQKGIFTAKGEKVQILCIFLIVGIVDKL